MIMKKYFGGIFEAMTKARHALHCTVGTDTTTESNIYYQRFRRFNNIFGRDHKTFDKSIIERLLSDVLRIIQTMWKRAHDEGFAPSDYQQELKAAFAYVIYSIESMEGTILFLIGAINSGIFGTSAIDSMIVDITSVYSFKIVISQALAFNIGNLDPHEHELVAGYPTLRSVLEHADWIDCGDDNLTQVSDEYAKVVNFKTIASVLEEWFGISCTPPNKDEEAYMFGTLESESFCSHFFRGQYPFVTWALKKESIERQLFWVPSTGVDEIETQMLYGVMPMAARWQDEAYYNKVRRAVRLILERTDRKSVV